MVRQLRIRFLQHKTDRCLFFSNLQGTNINKKTPEGVYAGCVGLKLLTQYVFLLIVRSWISMVQSNLTCT